MSQSSQTVNSPFSPDNPDITKIILLMRVPYPAGLRIKDRKWHFKIYPECFVAQEAVDWVYKNGRNDFDTFKRSNAVSILSTMTELKYIQHVVDSEKLFEDKNLFYIFTSESPSPPQSNFIEPLLSAPPPKNHVRKHSHGMTSILDFLNENSPPPPKPISSARKSKPPGSPPQKSKKVPGSPPVSKKLRPRSSTLFTRTPTKMSDAQEGINPNIYIPNLTPNSPKNYAKRSALISPRALQAGAKQLKNAQSKRFKFFKKNGKSEDSTESTTPPLKQYFGVSLNDLAKRDYRLIPSFISDIISFAKSVAPEAVGMFRKSGKQSIVDQLVKEIDSGQQVKFNDCEDQNAPLAILKLFLRQLPDPLFPFKYFDTLMEYSSIQNKEEKIKNIDKLIQSLPLTNQSLLKHIVEMMDYIQQFSDTNKMTANNLALVIGPNILRSLDDSPEAELRFSSKVRNIIYELIVNCKTFFPPPAVQNFTKILPDTSQSGDVLISPELELVDDDIASLLEDEDLEILQTQQNNKAQNTSTNSKLEKTLSEDDFLSIDD